MKHSGHHLIDPFTYFSQSLHRGISLSEFEDGMNHIDFDGDAEQLFKELDVDGLGLLTMADICPLSSDLWVSFKHWCTSTFASPENMIQKLSGKKTNDAKKTRVAEDGMTRKQFFQHASSVGWYGGYEQLLFMVMDRSRKHVVKDSDIPWFEEAKTVQRLRAKNKAKSKEGSASMIDRLRCMRKRLHAIRSLTAFTAWLRIKYGPFLFHPWRRGIDKNGSMSVSRAELFTFCRSSGWGGDPIAVWHALDEDDSGSTSLEEFAGREARQLALFKKWVISTFGSMQKAFSAFLKRCRKRAKEDQLFDKADWSFVCESFGYKHDAGEVFDILDWEEEGNASLTFREVRWLDSWQPTKWLSAEPNPAAAEEFRSLLLQKTGHPWKAWRILDDDNSGKVNFKEFEHATKRLGFQLDMEGAWVALDEDSSGYISLMEISPSSAELLSEFRRWANHSYGSVIQAFRALDVDGSGGLNRSEFKKASKKHGFKGDHESLFTIFDASGDGSISVEEMAFLDEWEISEVSVEPTPTFQEMQNILQGDNSESEASGSEGEPPPPKQTSNVRHNSVFVKEAQRVTITALGAPAHTPTDGPTLIRLLGGFNSIVSGSGTRVNRSAQPVYDREATHMSQGFAHHQTSYTSSNFDSHPFGRMLNEPDSHQNSYVSIACTSSTSDQRPYLGSTSRVGLGRAPNSHQNSFLSIARSTSTSNSRGGRGRARKQVPYIGGIPLMTSRSRSRLPPPIQSKPSRSQNIRWGNSWLDSL